jgi:ubiquitin
VIQDKEGILQDQRPLTLAGTQLDDGQTLQDYNIQKAGSRHLEVRLGGGMHTFVKTLASQTSTFEVEGTNTLDAMKAKVIQDKEGILQDQRPLTLAGTQLEDIRPLQDDNRQKEGTLHLEVRLPGGMRTFAKKTLATTGEDKTLDAEKKVAELKAEPEAGERVSHTAATAGQHDKSQDPLVNGRRNGRPTRAIRGHHIWGLAIILCLAIGAVE